MKSVRIAVVLIALSGSSVGATQNNRAAAPSHHFLDEWLLCQREFVTPLLNSSEPIPTVVEQAHAHCVGQEYSLRKALNSEKGEDDGAALFASIREASDRIVCGLLTTVRIPGDHKVSFDTAADCLAGKIIVSP